MAHTPFGTLDTSAAPPAKQQARPEPQKAILLTFNLHIILGRQQAAAVVQQGQAAMGISNRLQALQPSSGSIWCYQMILCRAGAGDISSQAREVAAAGADDGSELVLLS